MWIFIVIFIPDTKMARRNIAWSSGTGMAKGSNGTTVPAALRLSSSVKCSDQFCEKGRRKGLNARENLCANHWFAACPQGDPRGNCVWHSHRPSVRFSGLSKVERDLTWHVRSDWKRCVISRSLPLSRFACSESMSVCAKRHPVQSVLFVKESPGGKPSVE